MNKVLLVSMFCLMFVGCGKDGRNGSDGTNGASAPSDVSVLSVFTATDPNSRIPSLNLSGLTLNSVSPITSVIDCAALLNGQQDESGGSSAAPVNGVGFNEVGLSGSTTSGIIQFGPLSHADHNSNDVCYSIGQEEYTYNIEGNTLTLCDEKYASCSTFTKE